MNHHVIETFLGWNRTTWKTTPEWLDFRMKLFDRFTLRSISNLDSCPIDVLVQASPENRDQIEAFNFRYPRIELCFDHGREYYQNIRQDWVIITRIDSDDLFHKNAIAEAKAAAITIIESKRPKPVRTVLTFPNYWTFDIINKALIPPRDPAPTSGPFFTHIFPRSIFTYWDKFEELHFRPHGASGAGDTSGFKLRPDRICTTKHGQNASYRKKGLEWPKVPLEARASWYKGTGAIFDIEKQNEILREFGIYAEMAND
jgi:hypothetical protein